MEAIAEAEARVASLLCEPCRALIELSGGASFGHENHASCGDFELLHELVDFREVEFIADDEFEPRLLGVNQARENLGLDA